MTATEMYGREKANQAYLEDIRRKSRDGRLVRSQEPRMPAARPAVARRAAGRRVVIGLSGAVRTVLCVLAAVAVFSAKSASALSLVM